MIGTLLLVVGLLVGDKAAAVFTLFLLSVLGAWLCFVGAQIAMMLLDVKERADLSMVITMQAFRYNGVRA